MCIQINFPSWQSEKGKLPGTYSTRCKQFAKFVVARNNIDTQEEATLIDFS